MLTIPCGKDLLLSAPLVTPGDGEWLKAGPTLAAGDVKVWHDRLAPTNPAAKVVAFTSGGTYEVRPGDTLTGATSAATAVVIGVVLESGTWAGGNAAGYLFVRDDAGTFQAENLDVGASANVATIAGALGASGVPVFSTTFDRLFVAVPGSQLLGARGAIDIVDQTATEEWEDTGYNFETTDHPHANAPGDCLAAGTAASVTGTTLVAENGTVGVTHPIEAHEALAPRWALYIEDATTGFGQWAPVLTYTFSSRTFALRAAFAVTPTGDVSYKLYPISLMPVDVVEWKSATAPAMTGDAFARLGAPAGASIAADLAVIEGQTDDIGAAGAGLTALASAANLATLDGKVDTVDTVVDAIKAKTDNLPTDPADQSVVIAATDAILTAVGDVPTNAELATALGTADDAVLAQVALVKAKTDLIPAAPAAVGDIPTAAAIADAVHDEVVDGATTFRESVRLLNSAAGGKASGLGSGTPVYRDLADTKDRITATTDDDGNRSAVTRDLT